MNCQRGEMAMLVWGKQAGVVVTCIELVDAAPGYLPFRRPTWRIDRLLNWNDHGVTRREAYCPDHVLMPLRPPREDDVSDTHERLEETA